MKWYYVRMTPRGRSKPLPQLNKEAEPQGAPRAALFSFIQNPSAVKSSQVVDETGEPLVIYHGTPTWTFDEFDIEKRGDLSLTTEQGPGFYLINTYTLSDFGLSNLTDLANI